MTRRITALEGFRCQCSQRTSLVNSGFVNSLHTFAQHTVVSKDSLGSDVNRFPGYFMGIQKECPWCE